MLDLHMHTTASDGTDTPGGLMDKCAALALELCSVTDHDTIDSQREAAARAGELGLNYISGVELSVIHEGELHILGYGVDTAKDTPFSASMDELIASRVDRAYAILSKLRGHGINLDINEVKSFAGGNALGRPHVALALCSKGYALSVHDAFMKYLNEGGPGYVQRRKLTAAQAIELILSAGGAPVLAHPNFIRTDDMDALVKQLTKDGMMGIEAYYPAHSDEDVQRYLALAEKYGLLVTAGSDYHGTMRDYVSLACERRTGPLLRKSVEELKRRYVKREIGSK